MVLAGLGLMFLGAGIAFAVCCWIMRRDERDWVEVIHLLKESHVQEINEINKGWSEFTRKLTGLSEEQEEQDNDD